MKKTFLILSFCLLIISCGSSGDESDLSFSNLGSDEYPQMFYMEYVPCQEGVYYSAENFRNDVLPEWQDLLVEVNSPLVSADTKGEFTSTKRSCHSGKTSFLKFSAE